MKKVQSFHWEVREKAFRDNDGDHELPERTVIKQADYSLRISEHCGAL
jgi:hypothetical protein